MEKNVEEIQKMMVEVHVLLEAWGLRSRSQIECVKKKFDATIREMEFHDELLARATDGAPLSATEVNKLATHASRLGLLLSDLKTVPMPALPRAACN